MQGIIIVMESCDGSGKETQTKLLSETLTKDGIENVTIAFPTYGKTSAIPAEAFLEGKLGSAADLSPLEISTLFLFNMSVELRKMEIEKLLEKGVVVIIDRYVSSNLITNGARINKKKKRKDFAGRIMALAYGIFSLPEPDVEFYLDISSDTMLKNIRNRNGKKDINKSDDSLMKKTNKVGKQVAKWNKMISIKCDREDGNLRTKEDISKEISDIIKEILITLESSETDNPIGKEQKCATCMSSGSNNTSETNIKRE